MNAVIEARQSTAASPLSVAALRDFIEHEAALLDERRFQDWYELFADDGVYWAPAVHGQESGFTHVSLFFDDKHTLKTRITRLLHPQIHCQEPASHCVRVVSSVRLEAPPADGEYLVGSRLVMVEDRTGAPQRVFGARCQHRLREVAAGELRIVHKRVELTNCEQSFPMLTQPF